jgi:hypothetical protein
MGMESLAPEELAVWRVMANADPNAKLSAPEAAAIASATGHQRIETDIATEILKRMVRRGFAQSAGARTTGRRTQQIYWLTPTGKAHAVKAMNR